eukprot:gene10301-6813_t
MPGPSPAGTAAAAAPACSSPLLIFASPSPSTSASSRSYASRASFTATSATACAVFDKEWQAGEIAGTHPAKGVWVRCDDGRKVDWMHRRTLYKELRPVRDKDGGKQTRVADAKEATALRRWGITDLKVCAWRAGIVRGVEEVKSRYRLIIVGATHAAAADAPWGMRIGLAALDALLHEREDGDTPPKTEARPTDAGFETQKGREGPKGNGRVSGNGKGAAAGDPPAAPVATPDRVQPYGAKGVSAAAARRGGGADAAQHARDTSPATRSSAGRGQGAQLRSARGAEAGAAEQHHADTGRSGGDEEEHEEDEEDAEAHVARNNITDTDAEDEVAEDAARGAAGDEEERHEEERERRTPRRAQVEAEAEQEEQAEAGEEGAGGPHAARRAAAGGPTRRSATRARRRRQRSARRAGRPGEEERRGTAGGLSRARTAEERQRSERSDARRAGGPSAEEERGASDRAGRAGGLRRRRAADLLASLVGEASHPGPPKRGPAFAQYQKEHKEGLKREVQDAVWRATGPDNEAVVCLTLPAHDLLASLAAPGAATPLAEQKPSIKDWPLTKWPANCKWCIHLDPGSKVLTELLPGPTVVAARVRADAEESNGNDKSWRGNNVTLFVTARGTSALGAVAKLRPERCARKASAVRVDMAYPQTAWHHAARWPVVKGTAGKVAKELAARGSELREEVDGVRHLTRAQANEVAYGCGYITETHWQQRLGTREKREEGREVAAERVADRRQRSDERPPTRTEMRRPKDNELRVIQLNCDGLRRRLVELRRLLVVHQPHVVCLQETRLPVAAELPRFDGYAAVRGGRDGFAGGRGLVTLFRDGLQWRPARRDPHERAREERERGTDMQTADFIVTPAGGDDDDLHVVNLYIGHTHVDESGEARVGEPLDVRLDRLPTGALIAGDANAREASWDHSIPPRCNNLSTVRGRVLRRWADDNALRLLNEGTPTRHQGTTTSAPDVTVAPARYARADWRVLEEVGVDHLPVQTTIRLRAPPIPRRKAASRWAWPKADWAAYEAETERAMGKVLDAAANSGSTVHTLNTLFTEAVLAAAGTTIPRGGGRPSPKAWWTPEVAAVVTRRREARQRARDTRDPADVREWQRCNRQAEAAICAQKREHWRGYVTELNRTTHTDRLHATIRAMDGRRRASTDMPVIYDGAKPLTTARRKAKLFATGYAEVCRLRTTDRAAEARLRAEVQERLREPDPRADDADGLRRDMAGLCVLPYDPAPKVLGVRCDERLEAKEAARRLEQARVPIPGRLARTVLKAQLRGRLAEQLERDAPEHHWTHATGGAAAPQHHPALDRQGQRMISQLRANRAINTGAYRYQVSLATRRLRCPAEGATGLRWDDRGVFTGIAEDSPAAA